MQRILDLYISCFEYDVAVFSQGWIYWLFLIPALLYLVFFFIKWTVLTAPFWIPVTMVIKACRRPHAERVIEAAMARPSEPRLPRSERMPISDMLAQARGPAPPPPPPPPPRSRARRAASRVLDSLRHPRTRSIELDEPPGIDGEPS